MLPLAREMRQILLRKKLETLPGALTCVNLRYRCHLRAAQVQPVAAVVALDESLLRHFEEVRPQSSQAYSDLKVMKTEVELSL
jgi:hypothetical protein